MSKFLCRIMLVIRVAFLWTAVFVMGIAVRIRPALPGTLAYGPLLLGALLAFAAGQFTGEILFR